MSLTCFLPHFFAIGFYFSLIFFLVIVKIIFLAFSKVIVLFGVFQPFCPCLELITQLFGYGDSEFIKYVFAGVISSLVTQLNAFKNLTSESQS